MATSPRIVKKATDNESIHHPLLDKEFSVNKTTKVRAIIADAIMDNNVSDITPEIKKTFCRYVRSAKSMFFPCVKV